MEHGICEVCGDLTPKAEDMMCPRCFGGTAMVGAILFLLLGSAWIFFYF
jgi:hypothetical protein